MDETQRLQTLLPDALRHSVTIAQALDVKPPLIQTQLLKKRGFEIQIDFLQWQCFDPAQRDLLFWHEVARIQNRAIVPNKPDLMMLGAGLGNGFTRYSHAECAVAFWLFVSRRVGGLSALSATSWRTEPQESNCRRPVCDRAGNAVWLRLFHRLRPFAQRTHKRWQSKLHTTPNEYDMQRVKNVLEIFARHHNGCADTGSTDTDDRTRHSRPPLSLKTQS